MNLQGIWIGFDYAYEAYKGNKFPMHAQRGTVLRIEKQQNGTGQRATSYVWFRRVSDGQEVRIRARDVWGHWQDYENERNAIRAENQRKQEERDRQHEEWMRERRERQERERREAEERAEREAREREAWVTNFCDTTGIPKEAIQGVTAWSITLKREPVDAMLKIRDLPEVVHDN